MHALRLYTKLEHPSSVRIFGIIVVECMHEEVVTKNNLKAAWCLFGSRRFRHKSVRLDPKPTSVLGTVATFAE